MAELLLNQQGHILCLFNLKAVSKYELKCIMNINSKSSWFGKHYTEFQLGVKLDDRAQNFLNMIWNCRKKYNIAIKEHNDILKTRTFWPFFNIL